MLVNEGIISDNGNFILLFGSTIGQEKLVCDSSTKYVLDQNFPSVFLQFERFGKVEPTISNDGLSGKIDKGDDVWLSIHNNGSWDIFFEGWFIGMGRNGEKGWVLRTPGIGNADFITVDPSGKYVPAEPERGDARTIMYLAPGASMQFPVKKKQLIDRFVYVEFSYGWEGNSAIKPVHRAYYRRDIRSADSR